MAYKGSQLFNQCALSSNAWRQLRAPCLVHHESSSRFLCGTGAATEDRHYMAKKRNLPDLNFWKLGTHSHKVIHIFTQRSIVWENKDYPGDSSQGKRLFWLIALKVCLIIWAQFPPVFLQYETIVLLPIFKCSDKMFIESCTRQDSSGVAPHNCKSNSLRSNIHSVFGLHHLFN